MEGYSLTELPTEILQLILDRLAPYDLGNISRTCVIFRDLARKMPQISQEFACDLTVNCPLSWSRSKLSNSRQASLFSGADLAAQNVHVSLLQRGNALQTF